LHPVKSSIGRKKGVLMRNWAVLGVFAVPVIEIALFVMIGGAIGVLATLGWILLSFFAGVSILQRQARRQPIAMTQGDAFPFLANQLLTLFAAVLLILPGFFTDFLGLMLLLPPIRRLMIGLVSVSIVARFGKYAQRGSRAGYDAGIVDADFVDVTPKSDRTYRPLENQDH
jgi:UPF0716 protein FxsA